MRKNVKEKINCFNGGGSCNTATLTGCGNNEGIVESYFVGEGTVNDDYIIIEQNDVQVLHKGDYYRGAKGGTNGFVFDCGEQFWSNAEHYASEDAPKADRYDEKCEDCFVNKQ